MAANDVIAVYDLEYTSWEGAHQRDWSGPGEHMEIVQIGAVKLDGGKELKEIGGFEILVRPSINPRLSDYFTGLTGIEQADIDGNGRILNSDVNPVLDAIVSLTVPKPTGHTCGPRCPS